MRLTDILACLADLIRISVTDDASDNPPPNLTHIVVSDEVVELGSAIDDGSFDVAEWSGVLGNNLSENIHAVLNNQSIAAADRWVCC